MANKWTIVGATEPYDIIRLRRITKATTNSDHFIVREPRQPQLTEHIVGNVNHRRILNPHIGTGADTPKISTANARIVVDNIVCDSVFCGRI
ncbi:MAG TPA: hypothetical protein VD971_09145 [Phycisphaerales bacterium]|nr:hypothetical protein [Phycisphaerales bacterium]